MLGEGGGSCYVPDNCEMEFAGQARGDEHGGAVSDRKKAEEK